MPSFDVVSRTVLMEVDNAVNGVKREIKQRYDLAGTKCDIERTDNTLLMTADDTMRLSQVEGLFRVHLARRKVDQGAFEFNDTQNAAGETIKRTISIMEGIDPDLGRKITKAVKEAKIKVQISSQGSELRVSGKKRDDLQKTIVFIKEMNIRQPLQYVNFRN